MDTLIDLFLHLDQHLAAVTATYGPWIYGLLFLIVFAETGLVVTPILPGDSLLFAAGALAATGALNPMVVVVVLPAACCVLLLAAGCWLLAACAYACASAGHSSQGPCSRSCLPFTFHLSSSSLRRMGTRERMDAAVAWRIEGER